MTMNHAFFCYAHPSGHWHVNMLFRGCLLDCMFVCLYVCLFAYLIDCMLVCMLVCFFVCLFAYLLFYLIACLLACLFYLVCLACLIISLLVCLLDCLFACLLVCLFLSDPVSPDPSQIQATSPDPDPFGPRPCQSRARPFQTLSVQTRPDPVFLSMLDSFRPSSLPAQCNLPVYSPSFSVRFLLS